MIKDKPIGVTIDCTGNPLLLFSDGCSYSKEVEQVLYKEYYLNDGFWPVEPGTGERLPAFNRKELLKEDCNDDYL